MYTLPYLRKPDVPGASRCKFEFLSQDTMDRDDRYMGKRRYRFNKWRPISDGFPQLHTKGQILHVDPEQPIVGILSPWTIPPQDTGSVRFTLGPQIIEQWDATTDLIEVGVGFVRYMEDWWGLAEACELLCQRSSKAPSTRTYSTLRMQPYGGIQLFNPANYCNFTLHYSPTSMSIVYDEYLEDGTGVSSDTTTLNHTNGFLPNSAHYRVMLYFRCKGETATAGIPLIASRIDFPSLQLDKGETVWFQENPHSFTLPMAPLRAMGTNLYKHPYRAFIEDSVISVSSPHTPPLWLRTLDFIVTGTIEPFKFTDPDGTEWLCCFEGVKANSGRLTGSKGVGYELTMPIMVVH